MYISEIYCHPVKSMRGIQLDEAILTPTGIEGDRQYAVIQRKNNRILTARERPVMVGIQPSFRAGGKLVLSFKGQTITVNDPKSAMHDGYKVWDDIVSAVIFEGEVAEFLSDITGVDCFLAQTTENSQRQGQVAVYPNTFVDLAPLLVTTDESLQTLNQHLDHEINQRHFRPNIVVKGAPRAYDEDYWHYVTFGDIKAEILMGCTRCSIPDVDVDRFEQVKHMPVAKALKQTRQGSDKRLYFGQNARSLGFGLVKVGDAVTVDGRRDQQIYHDASKQIYRK